MPSEAVQLTAEQEAAARDVERGCCALIMACPGAGKTTFAGALARRLMAMNGGDVLVITYNKQLEMDLNEKAKCMGLDNLEASTIHGLVGRQSGVQCTDDAEMLRIVEDASVRMQSLHKAVLYIDEAQDLRPLFVEALLKVFASCVGFPRMVVCGDEHQMLYDFNSLGTDRASSRFLQCAPEVFGSVSGQREWTRHTFTKSFRLTPNIATFVNAWWGTHIEGCNHRVPNLKVHYIYMNPYRKELSHMIEQSIAKYGRDQVLLVGQSTKPTTPLTQQTNHMRTPVHLRNDGGSVSVLELAKKTHVLTACKSKGSEYKAVYLVGFHVHNTDLMMAVNQVCVGLSRASVELNVVHGEGKWIYPIGGDMDRMDESYEMLQKLVNEGVVSVVAPPQRPLEAPLSRSCTQKCVSDCTRVNARDLREIKHALGADTVHLSYVSVDASKMAYDSGRSFRGLHYMVADIVGDAVPIAFQAKRGVVPVLVVKKILGATLGSKHRQYTHYSACAALQRDGVTVDMTKFMPFEGHRSFDEVCEKLKGCISRDGVPVDVAENCASEFVSHLKAARGVCAEGGGLVSGPKPSSTWFYLAAVMRACDGYRNRFAHMGIKQAAYEWCMDECLGEAMRVLDENVPSGGMWEHQLQFISPTPGDTGFLRLVGFPDWVCMETARVIELKFVSSVTEEHRLQTQLYGALLACTLQKDAEATLFNVRTGYKEVYQVQLLQAVPMLTRVLQLHGH